VSLTAWRDQDRLVAAEARRRAGGAVARARDALDARLEALQLVAHNVAADPRLEAAIRGRATAQSIAELLSEPSWRPREPALTMALSQGGALAYRDAEFPLGGLAQGAVGAAWAGRRPAAALVVAGGRVFALATAPVRTGASGPPAVLALARPIDVELRAAAAQAAAAVVVGDGTRALEAAGEPTQADRLVRAVAGAARQDLRRGAWAAAASPLPSDLVLWSAVDASDVAQQARYEAVGQAQRAWGTAAALSLLGILPLLRSRRRARASRADAILDEARSGSTPEACPPSAVTPRVQPVRGSRLGRYEVVDRIGEGGMAEIYTAVTSGANGFRRRFVVKRLRPELVDEETVSRFTDEAHLASSLVHPNIVPALDFERVHGECFMALEYIAGRDLGRLTRRLADRGALPLSPRAVLFVAHEVLAALEYAHGKRDEDGAPLGIVHRDVSPENILVSERGDVKLVDFGIAKAAHGQAPRTSLGRVRGHVCFMAPEQAQGRTVDRRADLFSLGLVVFYIFTRSHLYDGDTLYDRLVRAGRGPTGEDLRRIARLPAPLPDLLRRALAIEPEDRYQTAADFRRALAMHIDGGQAELAAALAHAFREELRAEQDRLATPVSRLRAAT
jgi:tRNA A-37 threonylcarbamoyl transferase component Bud32